MNRLPKVFKIIGIVLAIFLLSGTLIVAAQRINQPDRAQRRPPLLPTFLETPSPTRPANCVPLPQEKTIDIYVTPSPTPDHLETPDPNLLYESPSVTPIPFAHTYDLSPKVAAQDKWGIIVFRCDGTFDLYLGGPDINPDQSIILNPGDVIYNDFPPASLMGHEPPLATPGSPVPTATSMSYAPPG